MRHCETQLLFLRLPLPSAPEPEPCPKKSSNGFPKQRHRRAACPSPGASHNFGLPGTGHGCQLPPQEGLPSSAGPPQPRASAPGTLGEGVLPPCSPAIHIHPLFTPDKNTSYFLARIYTYIYIFLKSISQGSPNALSTSCDKTKHAPFETYSSSI